MKNKLSILVVALLAMIANSNAQQVGPNISWDNPNHEFGDIKEEAGKVTHNFTFTNTGNEPLTITNVRPSCGCTSSDYTKEPVAPGANGYVSATFNPENRPGKFSKSITITTNCNPPTSNLRFTGNVITKPQTVEDEYPRNLGELRLKTNHLALMKVSFSEVKQGELEMINTTDHNLTISFRNVPSHLQVKAEPENLLPGAKGLIKVTYDAKKKGDWGFLMDKVTVAINGDTDQNKNSISVSATIEENFDNLTPEQKANAPKIEFENSVFDFDTIPQGKNVDYSYKFKNTGKSDLIIRKIKPSCGCTIVSATNEIVKPGASSEIKMKFTSNGMVNRQNKSIAIITNDPTQSQVTLRVTGTVKELEKR
ncbi:MAG: DUF1573 domain-containing protein [Salinivirgaceae bacterium]